MKKVLLTTPCAPYDLGWGEDQMDLLSSRLARGHDIAGLRSELPTWGLYLIAENIKNPCTVLEYPHWDEFLDELKNGYDVIGIQLKTLNLERTVKMVRAIRQYSPKSEIVIGGYGVGALDEKQPGDVNEYGPWLKKNADHLCREEGVSYMRKLLGDAPYDRPITQYQMPYARFHVPGMRRFDVNFPSILVALGCPSACDFCNTSAFYKHKKIYVAEPEETYAFMRHHQEKLGDEMMNVILFDEDIFLNPEYVRELGRLIRSDRKTWGIRWISFGSVRALSQFEPEELREMGLGGVWIGVESGLVDGECAKAGFAKRDGAKTPPELFDDLHRHGIETIGSMILGFDHHTPENIEQDIDYFVGLKPMFYQVGPLTPCPGTKLYREQEAAGRLKPHFSYEHFHLWKDDVYELKNFGPGAMKKYFDLAHEKLRAVNGPPVLQFCEINLRAYETLRGSQSEFLRHQAEQSKTLAQGSLPLVRAIGNHPPSPQVKQRVRDIMAMADGLLDEQPLRDRLFGKALELVSTWRAERNDPLERPPVVSDPGVRWSLYNQGNAEPVRRGAFGPIEMARAGKQRARTVLRTDHVRVADATVGKARVATGDEDEESATAPRQGRRLPLAP